MMQIKDLLQKLAALFPHQLQTQDAIDAWYPIYRSALREGPDLTDAFQACLADWTRRDAPKPADIARHMARRSATTASGFSTGGQLAYARDRVAAKASEILEQAVNLGWLERCSLCTDTFPDCRCEAYHLAWDNAFAWLQREYAIQKGAARDNPYPARLTEEQLEAIRIARTAPALRQVSTMVPLGTVHMPMPESRFPGRGGGQERDSDFSGTEGADLADCAHGAPAGDTGAICYDENEEDRYRAI